MDSIIDFTRRTIAFFRQWALWISISAVILNVILFVNSAINDIYAQVQLYSWEKVSSGGQFFNSVLNIIGMIVPSNITAVLSLIVSIHILKMGLTIFLFAKKLYWDMLFYLNK